MVPDCDVIYAADRGWWAQNHKQLPYYPERWTHDKCAAINWDLNWVESVAGKGLCTKPGKIHQGRNSGFQAINLAYHFGVSRIVLLGYDMQHTGGATHWHGDHPPGLTNAENINEWLPGFGLLADGLKVAGVEVINCTRETALTCFQRGRIEYLD